MRIPPGDREIELNFDVLPVVLHAEDNTVKCRKCLIGVWQNIHFDTFFLQTLNRSGAGLKHNVILLQELHFIRERSDVGTQ